MKSRATSRTSSVIYIDSSRITISQGGTNLYLDVTSKNRRENTFFYEVLDFNDSKNTAVFSPEQMAFDYQSAEYHIRYFIDSIQQESYEAEESEEEAEAVTDSTESDSIETEDTKIYLSAEIPPEFPGGSDAMKNWLIENVKYPAAAKREKIMGLVEVTAVVEKDGSLTDVQVKRDIGGGCGDEAVQAVKEMPTWIPGQIKGEDKRVKTTIKVFFPPK